MQAQINTDQGLSSAEVKVHLPPPHVLEALKLNDSLETDEKSTADIVLQGERNAVLALESRLKSVISDLVCSFFHFSFSNRRESPKY